MGFSVGAVPQYALIAGIIRSMTGVCI